VRSSSLVRIAFLAVVAAAVVATIVALGRGGEPSIEDVRPTIVSDDRLMLAGSPAGVEHATRAMRDLGVNWVLLTASWARIAPQPSGARRPPFAASDPDAYPAASWAALDRAVQAAKRDGLAAMIELRGPSPRWALDRSGAPDAVEFGLFAAAVARRYSGRFRGLPGAVAFTIWSEPNRGASLRPQWRRTAAGWQLASAARYREMLYAAHAAIAGAAPDALVLIGSTAPAGSARPNGPGGDVAPLRFLRELACVSPGGAPLRTGACRRFRPLPGDGWAHHPYSGQRPPWLADPHPDDVRVADLRRLTETLEDLHEAGRLVGSMPVYVTAFGYGSAPAGSPRGLGLYRQARWLGEAERLVARTPGVRSFAQAPLRDDRPAGAGLELVDGAPKPALAAFAYPLVVRRTGPHRVRIWGRVRPPKRRGRFRVAVRAPGGEWHALAQFTRAATTSDDGYLSVDAQTAFGGLELDPRWAFRLELLHGGRWRPAGLPIFGAR
jgi:hypothetical protein